MVIVVGVFLNTHAVRSGHVGGPSGAQSGLPSKTPVLFVRLMGMPVALEFRIKISPLPPKSSVYAILVPSGDQVQL